MESTNSYCRLCASVTRSQNLRSFDSVRRESAVLLEAVQRIHPTICRGDALPQTVCKTCVRRVKALTKFVKEVEDAQTILERIFASCQTVKRENSTDNAGMEVGSRIENVPKKLKEEKITVYVKEEVKDEFVLAEQNSQFAEGIEIKIETYFRDPRENLPAQLVCPIAEMQLLPETIHDASEQTIISENSNKILERPLEGTIKCDKSHRNHPPPQIMSLKTIERTNPLWSEFWRCFRCDKVYDTLHELRNHSIEAHDKCVVFKCPTCPKKIYKLKLFLNHMILHCDLLKQCCELCNLRFKSKSEVIKHKRTQHAHENKKHKCVKCGVTFDNAVDLKCHKDSYTNVILKKHDRIYTCDHCDKNFPMKSLISKHMKNHYPHSYRCKLCPKTFKHKSYRDNHESSVHNTTSRFICQICGKICNSIGNLRAHVDVHTGNKRYSCDICKKKFRLPYQLRSHLLSHGGPSQHTCTICGKSFRYNSCLYQHKNTHATVKPYSCTLCPKDFSSWSNYNKHMKRIHGTNMAKIKAKRDEEVLDIEIRAKREGEIIDMDIEAKRDEDVLGNKGRDEEALGN